MSLRIRDDELHVPDFSIIRKNKLKVLAMISHEINSLLHETYHKKYQDDKTDVILKELSEKTAKKIINRIDKFVIYRSVQIS